MSAVSTRFADALISCLCRCFIAIKHASLAMGKANPSRGKEHSGGSIILTASGTILRCHRSGMRAEFSSTVAGIRSGAGSMDCTSLAARRALLELTPAQTARVRPR